MAYSQVTVQPSDLIILPVIEKATVLSGQKSKAEKTRKDKGRRKKRAERRRNDVRADGRKSRRKDKQGAQAAQPPTVTCSLLARYLIITGPAGPAWTDPKAATSSIQVLQSLFINRILKA